MARFTGPKHKLCRRLGECIWKNPNCPSIKRPVPPGQHGANVRRKKSVYGTQLLQKQKLKMHYGIMEKQLRRIFAKAKNMGGVTDSNLLMLLESRLDCIIYRLGFAASRDQARQLVRHGHFQVNGRRVNIPSFQVKPNDIVSMRLGSAAETVIRDATDLTASVAPWLQADHDGLTGKILKAPDRAEIDTAVQESLIVELYSK